jgi:hypothetical protein
LRAFQIVSLWGLSANRGEIGFDAREYIYCVYPQFFPGHI